MNDPYCYPGTSILKNKLDITNQRTLDLAEGELVIPNLGTIDTLLSKDTIFNLDYLKKLNKYIFGDLYEFAGEIRTINITKGERVLGGDTVRYAPYKEIEKQAAEAFTELNEINWSKLSLDEKAALFSIQIAKIWQIHPFREGNTRTTITLACQFADQHGFHMDRLIFKNSKSYTRDALVKASDGPYSEYNYLKDIFKSSMEIGLEKQPKSSIKEKIKKASNQSKSNTSYKQTRNER